ncbi:hypothetical protein ABT297_41845 [Dactylosporangium sp. NPDC000555]|uniref:hypothetical protein n=1 Tax=Dactylosporangium sp. NPDC000555 TaxID=3154260 RepID=UPI0033335940
MQLWRPVLGLVISLLITSVGVVLATNYRDLARKHVRAAMRWSPRLRPRNRIAERDALILDRAIGSIFAAMGTFMTVHAVSDILAATGLQ